MISTSTLFCFLVHATTSTFGVTAQGHIQQYMFSVLELQFSLAL